MATPPPTCVNNFFESLNSGTTASSKSPQTIGTLAGAIAGSLASLAIQLLAFLLLRLRLSRIYRPRSYLVPERQRIAPPPRGLYRWLFPVFTTSHLSIIQRCGLDAYFFLRFLRTMLKFFLPVSIIALPILLPINVYSGGDNLGLDQLAFGNVAPRYTRSRLWAHLVIAIGIIIWFCYVIFHELRGYIRVRQAYLTSPQHRIRASATTVLVTGIPKKWLTLEALSGLYDVFPGGIKNIWINRNFDALSEKVKERDQIALDLESAELNLIKMCRKKHAKSEKSKNKSSRKTSKENDAMENADAERLAQGHGLSAGQQADMPHQEMDVLHPAEEDHHQTATNTSSGQRKTPFGVVGQGLGAVGHGLGAIGKGVGTVGQRVVGDIDTGFTKAESGITHATDRANAGTGFVTDDELYRGPDEAVVAEASPQGGAPLASVAPSALPRTESAKVVAPHPFAAETTSSAGMNHATEKQGDTSNTMDDRRRKTRSWQLWKTHDESLALPSPTPQSGETDEFPLPGSKTAGDATAARNNSSQESFYSGRDDNHNKSKHGTSSYPQAYDAEWDDDKSGEPVWRRYIDAKDRETMRLPAVNQSWFPTLPFVGRKVDRIYWLRRELARLNLEIEHDQNNVQQYPFMTSAFIQFNHQVAAHMACQSVSHHIPQYMAPRLVEISPDDVIWDNMAVKWWERHVRTAIVLLICVGLIIVFIPLVTFTSLLSNVGQLAQTYCWLGWLGGLVDKQVPLALVQGILPAILLSLILLVVPIIFRLMIKQQGVPTGNDQELGVQNWYFAFLFIVVFLIVTLSKGLTTFLADIASNPTDIASNLAENLPNAVNYFYSYLLVQSLSNSAGALLQIFTLIQWFIFAPMFDSTPRSKWKRQTILSSVEWGSFFPPFTNFAVIGIVYSAIAPLILVFMLIIFGVFWIVYRYNVLYVYQFRHDTGGLLFPTAINQLFTGIYVLELCLVGLFFLSRDEQQNVSCIPQAIIMIVVAAFTVLYHWQLSKTFNPLYRYLPITLEDEAVIRDQEFARAQASRFAPLRASEDAGQENETTLAQARSPSTDGRDEATKAEASPVQTQQDAPQQQPLVARNTWRTEKWRHAAPDAVTRIAQLTGVAEQRQKAHAAAEEKHRQDVEAQKTVGDVLYSGIAEDLEDLSPEDRDLLVRYAFQHSALRARRPVVWIPRDRLGVSDDEIRRAQKMSTIEVEENGHKTQKTNIWMSNDGTALDAKGRAVFRRSPPDFSNVDLISL